MDDVLEIGAAESYTGIIRSPDAREHVPALVAAARTIGAAQIQNRGTLGGNLANASPAGDTLPVLLAYDAVVATDRRSLPIDKFFTGYRKTALQSDELITAVLLTPGRGVQQFAKVGTRNAIVIAVCSFALSLDPSRRRVGTGIGSAAPTPLRASAAEDFLAGELAWQAPAELSDAVVDRFGELVAAAASPIDDVRGTAAYRRRALSVLARRTLRWAWAAYRMGPST